jgi:uncharacterized protein
MFQDTHTRRVFVLFGIAAILALLTYSYTALTEMKYLFSGPTVISVEGTGEVFATPDVATFSFSVESKEKDSTTAQNKVAEIMDAIQAYLSEAGVEDKDIKTTSFDLSPRYEYPDTTCNEWGYCPPRGEPKLIGYTVSQSVTVKVRDIERAGDILSSIGDKGALNVSSLTFTIDDEDALLAEAREKAIKDAREKAEVLATNLDSRIVRMNGYWEENNGYPMPYGKGGDMMMFDSAIAESAPSAAVLPMGENTFTVKVNISYEIK